MELPSKTETRPRLFVGWHPSHPDVPVYVSFLGELPCWTLQATGPADAGKKDGNRRIDLDKIALKMYNSGSWAPEIKHHFRDVKQIIKNEMGFVLSSILRRLYEEQAELPIAQSKTRKRKTIMEGVKGDGPQYKKLKTEQPSKKGRPKMSGGPKGTGEILRGNKPSLHPGNTLVRSNGEPEKLDRPFLFNYGQRGPPQWPRTTLSGGRSRFEFATESSSKNEHTAPAISEASYQHTTDPLSKINNTAQAVSGASDQNVTDSASKIKNITPGISRASHQSTTESSSKTKDTAQAVKGGQRQRKDPLSGYKRKKFEPSEREEVGKSIRDWLKVWRDLANRMRDRK